MMAQAKAVKRDELDLTIEPFIAVPVMVLAGIVLVLSTGHAHAQMARRRRLHETLNKDNDAQTVFSRTNIVVAKIKRHLTYAPLFSKRHSREFRPLGRIHAGTIPSRVEAIVISAYIILNLIFCVAMVDWSRDIHSTMPRLRWTSGNLAALNLLPLLLTAGRNNPLIPLLGISFDTFNLFHRWLGRIVVAEGLVHTFAEMVDVVRWSTWKAYANLLWHEPLFLFGFIAICAFVAIFFQSISPLRHAFYEFFLHSHIALAVAAAVALWYHLHGLQPQYVILAGIIIWGLDRLVRLCLLVWRNCGWRWTTATIELLPDDVARVDVRMSRPWKFKAGQYMYMYMPTLGLWTSHPFSAAWSSVARSEHSEKSDSRESFNLLLGGRETMISFLIRRRDGFTSKMIEAAEKHLDGEVRVMALAEGPYGTIHSFESYGTVVLIAGGIGITYPISHMRELIHGFANRTVAMRRLTLIWVIRHLGHLSWIQPWMSYILTHPVVRATTLMHYQKPPLSLSIRIYITGQDPNHVDDNFPALPVDQVPWTHLAPPTVPVDIARGKPSFTGVLENEMEEQVGAMAVSVCGPGAMGDDVREAVRGVQGRKKVDLFEETFSW